jgi:Amt family ammonium transporter
MKKLLTVVSLILAGSASFAAAPVFNAADTVWVTLSSMLVFLMVPGLAFFYAGLVRKKNVLGTMMHSLIALAVIGIEWILIGYSMAFGPTVHGLVGNLQYLLLNGIDMNAIFPGYGIPVYVFLMFQGMFAVITPALISGAVADRIKFSSYVLFILAWGLIVYNPLAHWVWGGGFLTGKALDFAGGTVVHISSGFSAIVLALLLGKRRNYPDGTFQPHSLVLTTIGAALLWFGWFGFNAGSALAANQTASLAFLNTFAAPAAAILSWLAIETLFSGKPTALGWSSGMLAGLVAITPAAGFVEPLYAILMGLIAGVICFMGVLMRSKIGYDDSLDVLGIHGIGGVTGAILTGLFCTVNGKGYIAGNPEQVIWQLKAVAVTIAYAVVCSLVIGLVIKYTIGLRVDDTAENAGLDQTQHGERAYNQ